ncbi:MAG: hypothetical protein ACNA8W_04320, partial [Bradymonadaceae bacterium]
RSGTTTLANSGPDYEAALRELDVFLLQLGDVADDRRMDLLAEAEPAVAVEDIGDVDFQTSCNEQAQAHFEVGLGRLHHMWYPRARESFLQAAAADDTCAMAHWGVAMTHYTPLWAPPDQQSIREGSSAAQRALDLEAPTERERDFIAAIAAFYEDYEEVPHRVRADAYRDGWRRAHERDRSDVEAASFYALGILATAPTITETYEEQRRAGFILERVLEREPRHPGGHHYLLHAYDLPPLAEDALDIARAYADIAPTVPHALHMPSHIFVRLGMWDENIIWNLRSAEAAELHPVNGHTAMDFYHALDYVVYGYLQQGQDDRATQIAQQARRADSPQPHAGSAYASIAIPARIALEQRDWAAVMNLQALHEGAFNWRNFPHVRAVLHTVRAVGAVFQDDLERAQSEFAQLDELNAIVTEMDDPHWTPHVQAYRELVDALLDHARGDTATAIEKMRQVTAFQDSFDKHPIMPGRVIEAGEYLGMLLEFAGRFPEALEAYENALEQTPNRLQLYHGAAVSAHEAGLPEIAIHYFGRLAELVGDGDVNRPGSAAPD